MRSIGYSNYPLHLLESLFIIHAAPSTPHYPGLRIRERGCAAPGRRPRQPAPPARHPVADDRAPLGLGTALGHRSRDLAALRQRRAWPQQWRLRGCRPPLHRRALDPLPVQWVPSRAPRQRRVALRPAAASRRWR